MPESTQQPTNKPNNTPTPTNPNKFGGISTYQHHGSDSFRLVPTRSDSFRHSFALDPRRREVPSANVAGKINWSWRQAVGPAVWNADKHGQNLVKVGCAKELEIAGLQNTRTWKGSWSAALELNRLQENTTLTMEIIWYKNIRWYKCIFPNMSRRQNQYCWCVVRKY